MRQDDVAFAFSAAASACLLVIMARFFDYGKRRVAGRRLSRRVMIFCAAARLFPAAQNGLELGFIVSINEI
jgi:hypothetical protein